MIANSEEVIRLYINQMNEIYLRLVSANGMFHKQISTYFPATNYEFIALQLRSVLELIALANLIVNKKEYNDKYNRFEKDWNARLIFRDIERINPDYYPQPVIEKIISDYPDKKSEFIKSDKNYLIKKDFMKLYEKLNGYLHARNPYSHPKDYTFIDKEGFDLIDRIYNLLDEHIVHIQNSGILFVKMNRDINKSAEAFMFERMN